MEWHQMSGITQWLQQRVDSSRNDSPLGCLPLTLAYRYYLVWRNHMNMFPCTGSRMNTNYELIASWGRCQCWTWDPEIWQTSLAAHCCSMNIYIYIYIYIYICVCVCVYFRKWLNKTLYCMWTKDNQIFKHLLKLSWLFYHGFLIFTWISALNYGVPLGYILRVFVFLRQEYSQNQLYNVRSTSLNE